MSLEEYKKINNLLVDKIVSLNVENDNDKKDIFFLLIRKYEILDKLLEEIEEKICKLGDTL